MIPILIVLYSLLIRPQDMIVSKQSGDVLSSTTISIPSSNLLSSTYLSTSIDYIQAFNDALTQAGRNPSSQITDFGPYSILPVVDQLFLGFSTNYPTGADGAVILQYQDNSFTALPALDEQGIIDIDYDTTRNQLLIGGADPNYAGNGWDSGNAYTYRLDTLQLTKYRNTGLANVIHTIGQDITPDGTYLAGTHSYDPTGQTPDAYTQSGNNHNYFAEVFKSTDAGQNWSSIKKITSLDGQFITHTYEIKEFNGILYAALQAYGSKRHIAYSTDDGLTWTNLFPDKSFSASPKRFIIHQNKLIAQGFKSLKGKSYPALITIDQNNQTSTHFLPFYIRNFADWNTITSDQSRIYMIGETNQIWSTKDYDTWVKIFDLKQATNNPNKLISLAYWPAKNSLIAGSNGNPTLTGQPINHSNVHLISLSEIPDIDPHFSTTISDFPAFTSSTIISSYEPPPGSNYQIFWDFNQDNVAESTQLQASYTYGQEAIQQISLTLTDGQDTVRGIQAVPVRNPLTVSIDRNNLSQTDPNAVPRVTDQIQYSANITSLSDSQSPINYQWDFNGDGLIDSILPEPIQTYNQSGFFPVSLTVSNDLGSFSTTTNTAVIGKVEFNFSVDKSTGTAPLTVTFTNTSTVTDDPSKSYIFTWFAEGKSPADCVGETCTYTYTKPGSYDLVMTAKDNTFFLNSFDQTFPNAIVVSQDDNPSPSPIPRVTGDANQDNLVDDLDYQIWKDRYLHNINNPGEDPDFNADAKVDGIDYMIWLKESIKSQ